jgi:hypothetical protein
MWQSSDMLDRLDDMREDLNHNDFADEVSDLQNLFSASPILQQKAGAFVTEKVCCIVGELG